MKGFRKLSSIALLLCAFVYPPSLAEAKDISLSNARNEHAAPEANLIGDKTGELLIAQRRPGRYRIIRRRQLIRRRLPYGQYRIIRRRPPYGRYQNIRRREQFREREFIRRRQRYDRYQNIRGRYY